MRRGMRMMIECAIGILGCEQSDWIKSGGIKG